MQVLRNLALERCGLSYERAFALDEVKLQIEEMVMQELVEIFYTKIYAYKDEAFRGLFTSTKEDNV